MVEAGSRRSFGPADAELAATVTVNDPSFWRAVARRGSRGLGESYADGAWDCDDLVALVRIAAREVSRLDRWRAPLAPLRNAIAAPHAAQHARARARAGRGPLRPRERAVRAVPRRDDDLLLRGVRDAGDVAARGAAGEARHGVPQARARAGRSPPRDRDRLGVAGPARRGRVRLPRHHHDAVARAARRGHRARARGAGWTTASRWCSRTTATCAGATRSSPRSR